MSALNFTISGHVQGVFFRANTKESADELGVMGWVRNCEDGTLEVHAEGSDKKLDALEEWLRQGPPAADVKNVIVKETDIENYKEFEIVQ